MARKRVILHCGAPKTATTSVQAACRANLDALRADGIVYPAIARPAPADKTGARPFRRSLFDGDQPIPMGQAGHIFAFAGFQSDAPGVVEPAPSRIPVAQMVAERETVLRDFHASDAHTLILSSENTFFLAESLDLPRFRAALGPDVTLDLAVALRHPAELLHALYATRVVGRRRSKTPPGRYPFVAKFHDMGSYRGIVTTLRHGLAADRVIPFFMTDLFWPGRSLLGNFLSLIDCDSQVEMDVHARPTPAAEAVMFLWQMNQVDLARRAFLDCVHHMTGADAPRGPLARAGVTPSFFNAKAQTALDAAYQADLAWFETEFALSAPAGPDFAPRQTLVRNTRDTDRAFADHITPKLDPQSQRQLRRAMQALMARPAP